MLNRRSEEPSTTTNNYNFQRNSTTRQQSIFDKEQKDGFKFRNSAGREPRSKQQSQQGGFVNNVANSRGLFSLYRKSRFGKERRTWDYQGEGLRVSEAGRSNVDSLRRGKTRTEEFVEFDQILEQKEEIREECTVNGDSYSKVAAI